ncbi:MAG: polysaccharide deacetylase family protein [Opitutaceae bacterium]|nr:polysaccharide deacetylase family protein [Opitutaceae bacterium]
MAKWFAKRSWTIPAGRPVISFTFDDFPKSALTCGGAVLEQHGLAATYYTSFGLMGRTIETGLIFDQDDIPRLLQGGHELGCHTHDHCPAWETATADYMASVQRNATALAALVAGRQFETHSYPISYPRPATKRRLGRIFRGCRFGGQMRNADVVDLNCLSSFFLEQCGENIGSVERIIGETVESGGWLIFSTHDVEAAPTRYGCTPEFFERVVACAVRSGAEILPMAKMMATLGTSR